MPSNVTVLDFARAFASSIFGNDEEFENSQENQNELIAATQILIDMKMDLFEEVVS
jgi:hypothetical protein